MVDDMSAFKLALFLTFITVPISGWVVMFIATMILGSADISAVIAFIVWPVLFFYWIYDFTAIRV